MPSSSPARTVAGSFGKPVEWKSSKKVPKLRLYVPHKELLTFGVGDRVGCKISVRPGHQGTLTGIFCETLR